MSMIFSLLYFYYQQGHGKIKNKTAFSPYAQLMLCSWQGYADDQFWNLQ